MKNLRRIAALFLVAGAALVGGMVAGKPMDASAAGSSINCSIPNNVVCTISNPTGIKRVTVTLHTGLGDVNVVDKSYPACPKSVNVSWDPIVPSSSMVVEECNGTQLTLGGQQSAPSGLAAKTARLVVVAPQGNSRSNGVFFLRNTNAGGFDAQSLGLTAGPQRGVYGYVGSCSGSESSGNFILCDQQFVLLCKVLGGTWIPGKGGSGDCDGAHGNWPSDPPSGN